MIWTMLTANTERYARTPMTVNASRRAIPKVTRAITWSITNAPKRARRVARVVAMGSASTSQVILRPSIRLLVMNPHSLDAAADGVKVIERTARRPHISRHGAVRFRSHPDPASAERSECHGFGTPRVASWNDTSSAQDDDILPVIQCGGLVADAIETRHPTTP